jgi:hypothetical protein
MRACLSEIAALIVALSATTLDAHAVSRRVWVDPPADLAISPSSRAPERSDQPQLGSPEPDQELATLSLEPDAPQAPAERAQVAGSDLETGRQVEPGSDLEMGERMAVPERREGVRARPVQRLKRTAGRRHLQRVQTAELRRQNSGDTYR